MNAFAPLFWETLPVIAIAALAAWLIARRKGWKWRLGTFAGVFATIIVLEIALLPYARQIVAQGG
jgi:hypothetical protein